MHADAPFGGSLARAVRSGRHRQGLRQADLALAAGVSVRTVHEIEAGKPTMRLDVLERVLGALGLDITISDRAGPGEDPS